MWSKSHIYSKMGKLLLMNVRLGIYYINVELDIHIHDTIFCVLKFLRGGCTILLLFFRMTLCCTSHAKYYELGNKKLSKN